MTKLRVLDLFAGIGGFSLGLERTGGFETVAFCETDEHASQILAKHWPDVPNLGDVTSADFSKIEADVITAGFPCQDISNAGKRAGIEGSRSSLFWEVIRAAGVVGPQFVIMENVAALLHRGLDAVLAGLAAIGYDAEWHCLPAASFGAPHFRDRMFIIGRLDSNTATCKSDGSEDEPVSSGPGEREPRGMVIKARPPKHIWWLSEPRVDRVAHGIPCPMDELRGLGNSVVPQIAEWIGIQIMQAR